MKNNKKSISTKIKSFVLGAILVGVVAVTTVFSLTGCNTNTPNNPPTLSQPGDFDDNQTNNNQNNNNENNNQTNNNQTNNQTNNNQTNNNQNNNQTQQKTEAQKLKEAFDAFNTAVKEKVAARAKTTPENVEINYVNIQDGLLVVSCTTKSNTAEYTFRKVNINNISDMKSITSKVQDATLLQIAVDKTNPSTGCESDVEDALRDAGYIKSSDKVLSLSCSDVASTGAGGADRTYFSSVDAVVINASGKASKLNIDIIAPTTDVFGNLDDAKFVDRGSENLNDAAVVYEMMKSGNFQGALDYMQGNGME